MEKLNRITMNPAVMGGKPCIRRMRITAGMIVELVALGQTPGEIIKEYPLLEPEDIRQALKYASWKAEEIEISLETSVQ